MSPRLQALLDELREASRGFAALAADAPSDDWRRRPAEGSWSAAECLAHLNLTSQAYLPVVSRGIQEARALGARAPRIYRRDPMGWFLWRMIGPPARMRFSTAPAFIPSGDAPVDELLARFEALQAEAADLVREADGLPIHRVRVESPFDARVRYNLFSALSIVPRHQRRHLWQAERAVALGRPVERRGTESASRPLYQTVTPGRGGVMMNERKQRRDRERPTGEESPGGVPDPEGLETRPRGEGVPSPDGLESGDGRSWEATPDGLAARDAREDAAGSDGVEAREPRDATSAEDHLETRMPLEAGEGPRAPSGDALLDGSGSRHGVDGRDERPAGG